MIRIENVSFAYSVREGAGLDHVSLQVPPGRCLLLTGASGSGKTTLTRLVNGLIPRFYTGELHGRVVVRGRDMTGWSMSELAAVVGSVFQNPRSQFFNPDTTSEIAFGCENQGWPRRKIHARVERTVSVLGIAHLMDRSVFSLSSGERQMVAIASAHAAGAEIFVLDEPSSNLDAESTDRLGRVLQHLKDQGKTILIAEHRLHYLCGVADRVVHLERGRIVENWSMPEFLNLSTARRKEHGLRSRDLARIDVRQAAVYETAAPGHEVDCQVRGLSVSHSGRAPNRSADHGDLLRDVSFDFGPGRAMALVGSNGRGKTTLARCLCGLARERTGTVRLGGTRLSARSRVGRFYLVMQEAACQLFAGSVAAELGLCRSASRHASKLHAEVLERLGLCAVRGRHPMSLSGGEKQRLSIAVAVVQGADVLILDEPTSGLDYTSMLRVGETIDMLRAMGKRLCIITHDYEFLAHVCAHVLELGAHSQNRTYPLDLEHLPLLRRVFSMPGNARFSQTGKGKKECA